MLPDLTTILTAAAALAVVLALIVAAGRLAPLIGFASRRQRGRRLQIEETLALDPRRRLHLVVCDGRQVLLLTGGASDLVVDRLPPSVPPEPEAMP